MKKNTLALFLATLLIVATVPVTVAAEETEYYSFEYDFEEVTLEDVSSTFKLTQGATYVPTGEEWTLDTEENGNTRLCITKAADAKNSVADGPALQYWLPERVDGVVEIGVTITYDESMLERSAYSSAFLQSWCSTNAKPTQLAQNAVISLNPNENINFGGQKVIGFTPSLSNRNLYGAWEMPRVNSNQVPSEPIQLKVVHDFNNGISTAYKNGVQAGVYEGTMYNNFTSDRLGDCVRSMFENAAALNRVYFNPNFSYAKSNCRLYMDDIYIRQIAKKAPILSAVSAHDGEEGISVKNPINMTFDDPMKTETFDGIKLYKGADVFGEEVDVDCIISGDTGYTLVPRQPLDYVTEYTLMIPDTVESKQGGFYQTSAYTFTTQYATHEKNILLDFNDAADPGTPMGVEQYIKEKLGDDAKSVWHYGAWPAYNDGRLNRNYFLNEQYDDAVAVGTIDETNNLRIEGGKLTLRRNGSDTNSAGRYGTVPSKWRMTMPEPLDEGLVKLSFDIELPNAFTNDTNALFSITDTNYESVNVMDTGKNGGLLFGTNQAKPYAVPGVQNNANGFTGRGTSVAGNPDTFGAGNHHFEVTIDFEQTPHKIIMDMDDGAFTYTTNYLGDSFAEFTLYRANNGCNVPGTTKQSVVCLDNLSISQLIRPEAQCLILDEEPAAPIDEPITFVFATPMRHSAVCQFELYKNGEKIEDAPYTLSEDGLTFSFDEQLEYSMPYKVVIPEGLVADNNRELEGQTVSFHTMHKPTGIATGSIIFTDENGAEITQIQPTQTLLNANMHFDNVGNAQKNLFFIAAVYRDGMMEDIVFAKQIAAIGADGVATLQLSLPEDKTGITVSTFAWDGFGTMNTLAAPQVLAPAQ